MKKRVATSIIEGLEEFVDALRSGEVTKKLTCRTVSLDVQPKAFSPKHVVAVRKLLNASQGLFGSFIGVSPKTIRAWEQGGAKPSAMARRFLDEIRRNPDYWRKRFQESIKTKS